MIVRIVLSPVFPPIPTRRFDWCAYIDGEEEEGTYGYGESKQAALNELIEGELERSDFSLHEQAHEDFLMHLSGCNEKGES